VFVADDRIRGRAGRCQAVLEPYKRGRGARILVAQPMQQLDHERRRQRHAVQLVQDFRHGFSAACARTEQPVGEAVGLLADGPPARNQVGRTPQVLDQHDSQRDGDGPELADRKRLHALVRADEPGKQLRVEATVRVGDECPGDPEHAWISGQRTLCKLGQLSVIARRQVVADLADLRLDDVVIVDQPLCGGRACASLGNCPGNGAVGLEQGPSIVAQTRDQRPDRDGPGRHMLGDGQAFGVLLEALRAEDLRANHLGRFADGEAARATDEAQD